MAIETIGEAAYDTDWRVRVRCTWGPREGMKRVRECIHGAELDLAGGGIFHWECWRADCDVRDADHGG